MRRPIITSDSFFFFFCTLTIFTLPQVFNLNRAQEWKWSYPYSMNWDSLTKGWKIRFQDGTLKRTGKLMQAVSLAVWSEASVHLHVCLFMWPGPSDSMVAEFQGECSKKEGRNYVAFYAPVSEFPWHYHYHTQFMEGVTRTCLRSKRGHMDFISWWKTCWKIADMF